MRMNRRLDLNVWYEVRTEINIAEPLFQLPFAVVLLHRVLRDAKKRFDFEMRGLKLEGAWLVFSIKPADGLELPKIMQWVKQTFSARFNWLTGRKGHVWGERYESEILREGPPEGAGSTLCVELGSFALRNSRSGAAPRDVDWEAVEKSAKTPVPAGVTYTLTWDSPRLPGITVTTLISVKNAPEPAPPPA